MTHVPQHPIEVARKLAQQKLEVAMQILDLDGDGNLSQEEFRRVIGMAMCCSVLQCVPVQCVAVCCSVL